jgi:hypothetical protein
MSLLLLLQPSSGVSASLVARSTFTAADGTAITAITPEVGPAWVNQAGTVIINGNHADHGTAGTGGSIATVNSGVANVRVAATVDGAAGGCGLVVRCQDASHFWYVDYQSGTSVGIYEYTAGYVPRATAATALTGAQALEVVANGATITASLAGAQIATYASAALYQTATQQGMRFGGSPSTIDDFTVRTL